MTGFEDFINKQLSKSEANGTLRSLDHYESINKNQIIQNDKNYIDFLSNDYLNLAADNILGEFTKQSMEQYSHGSGASRMVSGNHKLYKDIETKLAAMCGKERALVLGSGYLANLGVISALVQKDDLIIADKLIHASMLDAAKLSGAKLIRFAHNNPDSCRQTLEKYRKQFQKCIILTEHVFSMDGDVGEIDALYALAMEYNAFLLVDEAHGFAVVPYNFKNKPHVIIGTLSKAVGCYGGYVAASKQVIKYLENYTRPLIFSTALPPIILLAIERALTIIEANPELCKKPLANARLFTKLLGIEEATSPIVPIKFNNIEKLLAAREKLKQLGFLVAAIRPPAVPSSSPRLRFTFSAMHSKEDITRLAYVVRSIIT